MLFILSSLRAPYIHCYSCMVIAVCMWVYSLHCRYFSSSNFLSILSLCSSLLCCIDWILFFLSVWLYSSPNPWKFAPRKFECLYVEFRFWEVSVKFPGFSNEKQCKMANTFHSYNKRWQFRSNVFIPLFLKEPRKFEVPADSNRSRPFHLEFSGVHCTTINIQTHFYNPIHPSKRPPIQITSSKVDIESTLSTYEVVMYFSQRGKAFRAPLK